MTENTKSKIQGVIAGLLVGTLVAGGIVTYASNFGTLRDVRMGGVRIVVDGKELHPTDANGNTVEPFIYNGTTYLPVRAVADAMNKAVYWDGPEFTVYLGEMDGELEYPTARIDELTSISHEPLLTDELYDNYGNRYKSALINEYKHTYLEYLLNMKYSRFKGTLYVPQGITSDDSIYLTIEADGKIIYTSPDMTKTSYPVEVDVNITGSNNVEIYFSDSNVWNDFSLCLGDAGFYQ